MDEQGQRPPPRNPRGAIDAAVWRVAATVVTGAMAVVFDATMVSVAIHDLARELNVPLGTIQWVGTGYLLPMFVTIPMAGVDFASAHVLVPLLVGGACVATFIARALSRPSRSLVDLTLFRHRPLATATAYAGLRGPEVSSASMITRIAQQLGGSTGTALLAFILQTATLDRDLAGGFRTAFWWAVALTAMAMPLSLLLPQRGGTEQALPVAEP
jgi:hypothetical protein